MGMLIEGRWTEEEKIIEDGAFVRQASAINKDIGSEQIRTLRDEPGRYHLIGSLSCQWSHRAMIVRQLKGLANTVPLHIAHGPRVQGYAVNGGATWEVPGMHTKIVHLHQLYTLGDPLHTGRSNVPVLWDSEDRRVVSNDSAAIMRALDAAPPSDRATDFTFLPEPLRERIDALNAEIYDGLSNGVYSAGFAEHQDAYDQAVEKVFDTLDVLETRLSSRRYLIGSTLTEADWRLFPTLVRFDAVYFVLHKCCKRRLIEYPSLWSYARDLYAWKGISETVDFTVMREASYANDTSSNANKIVAIAPDMDWTAPHGRNTLGPARITLRSGDAVEIDPETLATRRA